MRNPPVPRSERSISLGLSQLFDITEAVGEDEDAGPTLVVDPSQILSSSDTPEPLPAPTLSVPPRLRPPEAVDLRRPTGLEAPPPLPLRPPRTKRVMPWRFVTALVCCFFLGLTVVDYVRFQQIIAERNSLRTKLAQATSELVVAKSQISDLVAAREAQPAVEPSPEPEMNEIGRTIAAAYAPSAPKTAPRPKAKAMKPTGTKVVTVASVPPERTEMLKDELANVLASCEAAFGRKVCVKGTSSGQNVALVVSSDGNGMSERDAEQILSCFKDSPGEPFVGDLTKYRGGCQ